MMAAAVLVLNSCTNNVGGGYTGAGTDATGVSQQCVATANGQPAEHPYGLASGLKNGALLCYSNWVTNQSIRNLCIDSGESRSDSEQLMDASLENCLRDGATNCRVEATHLGVVDQGRVIRPLPVGMPNLARQSIVQYTPVPDRILNQFVGNWAQVFSSDDPDDRAKACQAASDYEKLTISLTPIPAHRSAIVTNRDYWTNLYFYNKGLDFLESRRVLSGQPGSITFVDQLINNGTCYDETHMAEPDWATKYGNQGVLKYYSTLDATNLKFPSLKAGNDRRKLTPTTVFGSLTISSEGVLTIKEANYANETGFTEKQYVQCH